MASIILPHRWQQQPQYPVEVDKSHPLGAALDFVWNGGARSFLDASGRLYPTPAASTIWTPTRQGLAISNTGTAASLTTLATSQQINKYPFILFGCGYFLSGANNWHLSPFFENSGGGYLAGIRLASSTQIDLYLRYNYGTARSLTLTLGSGVTSGLSIFAIAQIFSETDYRLYANGQQSNGTLSPGTLGAFNRIGSIGGTLNGGIWASGYGVGKSVPDEYAKWLTANPQAVWQIFRPLQRRIWVPVSAGGPTYTLTAAAGSFSLTGNAAGLTAARQITAASGSYTLTGNAANLTAARLLTAANGSFVLTGNAATLTYTPNVTYTLTAAAGSFTLTGNAANLTAARLLTAGNGIFTLTGHDAALVGPGDSVATAPVGGGIGHGGKQRKRKVYLERDGKLHVFIDAEHADAFLNATKAVKEARKLPKAKQIKKAIKAAEKAISEAKPALVLPLAAIPALAPNLHQAKAAEKLIRQAQWAHIVAMYEKWIEDDDEDILLLAA